MEILVTSSAIPYLKILHPHMGPPTTPGPWVPHHRNPALNQTSNRRIRIQTVVNNLKFMIVGYLAAKKSGNLDWCRDFCDWSINSHSIRKVMPSRHHTEYNAFRDNVLHTHTQHWSIDWNRDAAACLERYVQRDMLCPWTTAWANRLARAFLVITCQPL